MTAVVLQVEVPIACFRQSRAREYVETYPVPPPSTVYGMLLSLVGETDRYKYCGTRLAIALLSEPKKSVVLRKFHRHKTNNVLDPRNVRPDYQELLTNIQFRVWVDAGTAQAVPGLPERIKHAFTHSVEVERFGGLSLGESQHLINAITLVTGIVDQETGLWLSQEESGLLTLPYWVNHVGGQGTRWRRYTLQESLLNQPLELSWTEIQPF